MIHLYNRVTQLPVASVTIPAGTSSQLINGDRFVTLTTPVTLPAGFQGTIVTEINPTDDNWNSNGGAGTNPEEMIAAAHSGCFAMALSAALGEAGFTPETSEVIAAGNLNDVPPKGWTVTASHLVLVAKVPGIDPAKFEEIAGKAKANCPISRLLNATITLTSKLD